jgi:hypothetical protein
MRNHHPQQVRLLCMYMAVGDWCLLLPSNECLCDISLIPRFWRLGVMLQYWVWNFCATMCPSFFSCGEWQSEEWKTVSSPDWINQRWARRKSRPCWQCFLTKELLTQNSVAKDKLSTMCFTLKFYSISGRKWGRKGTEQAGVASWQCTSSHCIIGEVISDAVTDPSSGTSSLFSWLGYVWFLSIPTYKDFSERYTFLITGDPAAYIKC